MHNPTAFVTPVVEHGLEREIAQWVHPMKDRSDDPSHHERTLLPRSYISLPNRHQMYYTDRKQCLLVNLNLVKINLKQFHASDEITYVYFLLDASVMVMVILLQNNIGFKMCLFGINIL